MGFARLASLYRKVHLQTTVMLRSRIVVPSEVGVVSQEKGGTRLQTVVDLAESQPTRRSTTRSMSITGTKFS